MQAENIDFHISRLIANVLLKYQSELVLKLLLLGCRGDENAANWTLMVLSKIGMEETMRDAAEHSPAIYRN
jgi:hypothetical protein